MKKSMRLLLFTALGAFGMTAVAAYAATQNLGQHGEWSTYTFMEGGNKICYMASSPVKDEGAYKTRGDIFAMVTHRPAEGTNNVFSYIAGYPYKPGSEVIVEINGNKFTLVSQDDTAWAVDADTDARIAGALKTGSKMKVTGYSARGTKTVDTFSLKGSGAAYKEISAECGVQ